MKHTILINHHNNFSTDFLPWRKSLVHEAVSTATFLRWNEVICEGSRHFPSSPYREHFLQRRVNASVIVVKGQRGGEEKSVAHPPASLFYLAPCYTRRYVFHCVLSRGISYRFMNADVPRVVSNLI